MWFSYLKEQLIIERNTIEQLLEIDCKVQGTRIYFEQLFQFLEQKKTTWKFYPEISNQSVSLILEGNPICVMKVLSDYGNCPYSVYIYKNYYAINCWILKKYEEFCEYHSLEIHLSISIQDTFQILSTHCVLFGSLSFLNEMSDMICVPCTTILERA